MNIKLLQLSESRLIRLRDAPRYLGMDRHRFDRDVREFLIHIPIGKQGIAFDRLELDAWVEQYKARSGRPATKRKASWDAKEPPVSTNVVTVGTLTSKSLDAVFAKVLDYLSGVFEGV